MTQNEVPSVRPLGLRNIEIKAHNFLLHHFPEQFETAQPLPLVEFLEFSLAAHYGFELELHDHLDPGVMALTCFDTKTLKLLERDMRLLESFGDPQARRPRFTAAHEIGHVVLHANQLEGFYERSPNRRRLYRRDEIKPFKNPEWQANAFAAGILVPAKHLQPGMTPWEVQELFGVSTQVAEIRLEKYNEGKI